MHRPVHRPVLVTPPKILPVTMEDARRFIVIEADEDWPVLEGLLRTATEKLDGWDGTLGRCLVEQEWRQDFDCFQRTLPLPLLPVISISSVTYPGKDGGAAEVDPARYSRKTYATGFSSVVFNNDVAINGSVSVIYKAGYITAPAVPGDGEAPALPERSTVPAPIKTAIMMLAAQWYNTRENAITGTISTEMPFAVKELIESYNVRRL